MNYCEIPGLVSPRFDSFGFVPIFLGEEEVPMAPAKLEKSLLSRPPEKGSFRTALLGLSLLMLIFSLDQQTLLGLPGSFSATPEQVFGQREYWRAFTTMLLHADLKHLAANSLFFTGLAYLLNGYYGAWAFPVLSFIAGGLTNLIVLSAYPDGVTLVGISGVVYFMAAFWLTLYCLIQRSVSPGRRLVNAIALSLMLLFPTLFEPRVSYLAHAVGFALGIPFGAALFAVRKRAIRAQEVWRLPEPPAELELESSPQADSGEDAEPQAHQCG